MTADDPPVRARLRLGSVLLLILLLLRESINAGQSVAASSPSAPQVARGKELAKVVCATCHLFSEPSLLDRKTWLEQTLPRMKIRLGLAPELLELQREAALLKESGRIASVPLLSEEDFAAITAYYAAEAPTTAVPQGPRPTIEVGLPLFQYERGTFRHPVASTTLVHIDQAARRIYLGDDETKSLTIVNDHGELIRSLPVDNTPVHLARLLDGFCLTMIGSFMPSERTLGAVGYLKRADGELTLDRLWLRDLPRTVQTEIADLNHDGRPDLIVCQFGNNIGHFSWYENLGDWKFKEHVLIDKPGAVRAVVHDFNCDGHPDIAVLVTQETEAMFVLTNDGKGNFATQIAFQWPPVHGHTYFELADFNGDGRLDFLVTNGDNGEYPSPLKNYHGIRIYLNRDGRRFDEAFFFPLNGAFKAIARDFDQDGDLDIAAISFYPDYTNAPRESFVYLENLGGMKFRPRTFRQCIAGRWLVMDAGDVDGDGDLDIVLGSHIHGPSEVPDGLMLDWERSGPSLVILRNQLRVPESSLRRRD